MASDSLVKGWMFLCVLYLLLMTLLPAVNFPFSKFMDVKEFFIAANISVNDNKKNHAFSIQDVEVNNIGIKHSGLICF